MPGILAVTESRGIPVVEDCAQAHGAKLHGRPAGAWGVAGAFSFYPTKNLGAMGDAGAIVTADCTVAERARELRQYGWRGKYRVARPGGRNSRLDELQAAFLREFLPHLDRWNQRRRQIQANYNGKLSDLPLILPAACGTDHVVHLYTVRTPHRDRLAEALRQAGIQSDVHYPVPDHLQPFATDPFSVGRLEVTEASCRSLLTLPCFPEMTDQEVQHVVVSVRRFYEDNSLLS